MSNPPLKKEWDLTPAAFEKLLSALGPSREQAGYEYERLRLRLVKLFEWEKCLFPEEGADETINRVCRKLSDGEVIENLQAYCTSVARNIAREIRKGPDAKRVEWENFELVYEWLETYEREVEEERLDELYRRCLDGLMREKRALIVAYYEGEKRGKIESRQRLADRFGITLDALRTRAHRVRDEVRECIQRLLKIKKQ